MMRVVIAILLVALMLMLISRARMRVGQDFRTAPQSSDRR